MFPAAPIPPTTIRAPVVFDVDCVVLVMYIYEFPFTVINVPVFGNAMLALL